MGHISGKIASIVLNQPANIADLDFEKDDTGTYVRRRFTLNAGAQERNRVFNTSFFPDNPPFHDARHRSSVLSAVFLALAVPPIGRQILPEAIRRAHVGSGARHFGAHLRNVLVDGPRGVLVMSEIVRDRFLSKPWKPGFLVRNREGRYALHYHAEQEPNPESRVALRSEKDEFGLARVSIDLRFTENDASSVVRSHEILDSALRKSSMGRVEYWHPQEERVARVLAQAADGFHQAGTTRMGRDPNSSVVDTDLKAHDVANLYVASSSVFPTTGQANSTFLAVALAVRLAHHLQKKQASDARESDLHASR
jgi:choline dehydrogenase-like flavoprotein